MILRLGRGAAGAAILAAIFTVSGFAALLLIPEPASAYVSRAPILIGGDADFIPANGVTAGSGTPSDPFLIEGWEISASSADGIEIRDTRAHFVIRDVFVHSGIGYGLPSYWHEGVHLTNVSNGSVQGTALHDVYNGVRIVSSADVEVRDTTVAAEGQGYGVFAYRSSRITVLRATLSMAGGTGIGVSVSDNVTVAENDIDSSRGGIEFLYSADVSARNNTIRDAIWGLALDHTVRSEVSGNTFASAGMRVRGDSLGHFASHTIADDNLVNNRPLRYHRDCTGLRVDGVSTGQILVVNCRDVQLTNLRIDDTDDAVEMAYVENATLSDSVLSNSTAGASVFYSSNVTIVRNSFWKNGDGLGLIDVADARVHSNSFIINGAWELGGARNAWDDGYPAGGNYWTEYEGRDDCSGPAQDVCPDPDGIGDTPFRSDRYPLVGPGRGTPSELRVTVTTDKPVYTVGEPVQITVMVSNPTPRPITLYFSSSCQHSFAVKDPAGTTWYTPHPACLAVMTSYTLLAGESTRQFLFSWNQSDDSHHPVPPGDYVIWGFALSPGVPPGFARITIETAPAPPVDGHGARTMGAPEWAAATAGAIGLVAAMAVVLRWYRRRPS